MARAARSLSITCLVAAALLVLHASNAFVTTNKASASALRGRVAREASQEIQPTSEAKAARIKEPTGAFEYSKGARNEVSIITPMVSTDGIAKYLSLSVNFIGIILFFTIGGLYESQRFFPDALIWNNFDI